MAEMSEEARQKARCTEPPFPPSRLNELERAALDQRKLILLVSLDKTLLNYKEGHDDYLKDAHYLHTSQDNSVLRLTVRLRPDARWFLRTMKEKYNIYLVTNSSYECTLSMCQLLEVYEKLLEARIFCGNRTPNLLKDDLITDCFSPGTPLVVKLDHREDCWSQASNLLTIPPYDIFNLIQPASATTLGLKYEAGRHPLVDVEEKEKDEAYDRYLRDALKRDYWDIFHEETDLEFFTKFDKIDDPESTTFPTAETGRQGLPEPPLAQHLTAEEPVPGSKQGSSSVHGSASAAKASKEESTVNPQVLHYPENKNRLWFFYQGGTPMEFNDDLPDLVGVAAYLHRFHQIFFSVYDHYGKSECASTSAIFQFFKWREEEREEERQRMLD